MHPKEEKVGYYFHSGTCLGALETHVLLSFLWSIFCKWPVITATPQTLKNSSTWYINTLKRELVDTYAYKLQPSLSERVIVDGLGCHTALHFGVKAKENQDKVPTLYWLPKLHKKPIKQDLLQMLVLVRQKNFLNC